MSYEIIEKYWGIEGDWDGRWTSWRKRELSDVIEWSQEQEQDGFESDFDVLFEKTIENINLVDEDQYGDKVFILKSLWKILDTDIDRPRSQQTLFSGDIKEILLAIWRDRISNQAVIEDAFDKVFNIVQPWLKKQEEEFKQEVAIEMP